jgi:hypothetical protein
MQTEQKYYDHVAANSRGVAYRVEWVYAAAGTKLPSRAASESDDDAAVRG